jgi:chorismate mutase/prephenate dehydratase
MPDAEALLAGPRAEINALDDLLLQTLNKRAAVSLEIGRLKHARGLPVFVPAREADLLERLSAANPGPLSAAQLRAVYREILSVSRALQQPLRVACLGPEGTFSHLACLEYFGSSYLCLPLPSFADVFAAVENGEAGLAAVPLENSLHGTVGQCLDLFTRHNVHVRAEWISRIRLSLLTRGQPLASIRVVYSHAQPLGQCARWLREHIPQAEQISVESTAIAAARAAAEEGGAAIAHAGLAETHGLNIAATGLEDAAGNWTRFFAISAEPGADMNADKSSIVFTLKDKPGALAAVLRVFADTGINLSKLESRPLPGERWKYIFFADLDCNINSPARAATLAEAHGLCHSLRVLGAYMRCGHEQPLA